MGGAGSLALAPLALSSGIGCGGGGLELGDTFQEARLAHLELGHLRET
jgi:hypothetical protein